ncbi:MAG: C_GCAxxG_C_C family protein [Clostridia bacterium]|nr:C_GCAxxG_C_C family protein [Clostridia bacterium]
MVDKEFLADEAKRIAMNYFKEGLNCAECVLQAIIDVGLIKDFPKDIVALATGFGGGIGLSGNLCGALSGAVLAVSCIHGRKNPLAKENPKERILELDGERGVYRLFNNLPREFKEQFGDVNCGKIVEPYDWQSKERRKNCHNIIGESAKLAVKWILIGNEEGFTQPFGPNVAGIQN